MEWGSLVEKAKEGGFATTLIPDGDYDVVISGSKYRKSGVNHQLIVNYRVLVGPYTGSEVADFLTFSDSAGGIAFQKISQVGGDAAFLARLQDFGPSVNEPGVRFIADTLFNEGKVLKVTAKTSTNGKNNNFTVKEVVTTAQPVPAPAAAQAAPTVPVENPYAVPVGVPVPPVPAANPNLPI